MHKVWPIQPISLPVGLIAVGVLSAAVTLATSWVKTARIQVDILYVAPFALSCFIYWAPVWFFGYSSPGYSAWGLAFVIPWTIAGVVASGIASDLLLRWLKSKPRTGA